MKSFHNILNFPKDLYRFGRKNLMEQQLQTLKLRYSTQKIIVYEIQTLENQLILNP
jgi:hypothetical protein